MTTEEITRMVDGIILNISELDSKTQIEVLQSIKAGLSDRHSFELAAHEKRATELKQLIQDVKSV